MTPDGKDLCVFAVKRGDMKNRLDINYNLPQYTMLEEKLYQTFGENLKRISDIADVICGPFGSAIKNTDYQDSGIPLVRITNINKDGYMNYDDLIYKLIVEDDYRIDVELGENYSQTFEKESQRRIIAEPFNLRGDNTDRDFFEKVANAFYEDLGVHFKVLESVLHHLSDSSFSHDNVEFDEIAPNVIKAKATDVLNDYLSFVVENVPVEDVKSAYDFLTIVPGQLKTICAMSFFANHGYDTEGFTINPYMVVNKVFSSYYKHVQFPIVTFDELKREIQL